MTLAQLYDRELARRGHAPDRAQLAAVARLEQLRQRLERAVRRESGPWRRALGAFGHAPARRAVPGIYLWGGVGRGKTWLLDLFHATLAVPAQRSHFHRLMQDVHARLAALRPLELVDPLERVAADLAADTRVLCCDELQVGDIADAMLLAGLFGGLVARGVTLVMTSNTPPAGLYPGGLQRARFLPAIALLERHTRVLEVDAGADYRLRELERAPLYFDAALPDASERLAQRFAAMAGAPPPDAPGPVAAAAAASGPGAEGAQGRRAPAPQLVIAGRPLTLLGLRPGVAWFEFAALCDGPRATADYIELARQFHTLIVAAVPVFAAERDDAARRFVALVDELYERGVKLVLSAEAAPERLYRGARLAAEFRRTASRLVEMQTHPYLARPHRP